MRDRRFIAEHRGGLLKKEQHRQLIIWACECTEHLLPLIGKSTGIRLTDALAIAQKWSVGEATTGEARKAALACFAVANDSPNKVETAVARAAGHAVATAHMADHSLGPALYGLKAVKLAGRSVQKERQWQNSRLPQEIKNLVITSREQKEKHFRI